MAYYIYYISRGKNVKKRYIGQEARKDSNLEDYERICEHARSAYGLIQGKKSGASSIIKETSLCNISFRVYTAEDGYGFGDEFQKAYDEFCKYWTHETGVNTEESKIDFAEIAHILNAYYHGDHELTNIEGGGQKKWTFNQTNFLNILGPESNDDLNLETLTLHKGDLLKGFGLKIFQPIVYCLNRAIAKKLTKKLFFDPNNELKNRIVKIILNAILRSFPIKNGKLSFTLDEEELVEKINNYMKRQLHIEESNLAQKMGISVKDFKDMYSIKWDFTVIGRKIAKWLSARLNTEIKYAVEKDIKTVQGVKNLVKAISGGKITDRTTEAAKDIFVIKRNNYYLEANAKEERWINSPYASWYRIITKKPLNPYSNYEVRESLVNKMKNISYEKFVKVVKAVKGTQAPEPFNGQTLYNGPRRGEQLELYYQDKTKDYWKEVENTLRWKVREEYEKEGIHGGILHGWDMFYRYMITLYKKRQGDPLQVVNYLDEEDKVEVASEGNRKHNQTYKFYSTTWAQIQDLQKNEDLKGLKWY